MEDSKEIIGLDVGAKHTGIARASTQARLPEPLMDVDTAEAVEAIKKIAKEAELDSVVVGLPRNLKGEDTPQTRWVREWADKAKKQIGATFYFQDEALTSKAAQMQQLKSRSNVDEHALAATIILQDFLDTPEAERVVC